VKVLRLADGAASVVYRVEAQRADQPAYRALMSSTYIRVDGAWKLALHTQTPLGA
jgi:hypothetical protein